MRLVDGMRLVRPSPPRQHSIGVAESRGIKRGVVVNLEGAVDSIKKAIEEAELMAGIEDGIDNNLDNMTTYGGSKSP